MGFRNIRQYEEYERRTTNNFILYVFVPIFIVISIIAIILSSITIDQTNSLQRFDSITNYEPSELSISEDIHSTIAIPCTNKTLGSETRIFSGSTFLGFPCPKTDNECSEFICGEDAYCHLRVTTGGECYDDFNCDTGYFCNSTCLCEENPVIPECTVDSDCTEFNANPCIESKCVSNTCQINLTPGAQCSSTTQCNGGGFVCNATCMCTPVMISDGCMVDSDCQLDNTNPCVETICNMSVCVTNLISGATCSSTTQCTAGKSCNETCQCEDIPRQIECITDGDCQSFNANPCIETSCVNNQCETNLTTGATCSSTTQCTAGQSCNETCQCEDFPIPLECSIDADCEQFNANPCIETVCITNKCQSNLVAGATCSSTTQCTSGQSCNETCQCEDFPIPLECSIDADCEQFNANPCIETVCITNKCQSNLVAGATCSSTTQCTTGQSCNETCLCEQNPSSTKCTTVTDCQADNSNPCLETVCNSGTCETNLVAGASCSSTTQCSSGQSCNSTCLCETIQTPTTFSDATFAIYDNSDNTKIAQFEASGITTATTRVYSFPNVASSILAYTFASTAGNVNPNVAPWSTANQASYIITKISNVVIFNIGSNVHTAGTPANVDYNSLIPSGYRPTTSNSYAVMGSVTNQAVILLTVFTTGSISFTQVSGSPFPGSGTQGHYAISLSWSVA